MAIGPYWSGQIRLSLISIPVNIYPALNRFRQIALHEIYRPTGQRIRHQNVVDGHPVEWEDIVKGYEIEKGEYVILEPEEIDHIKISSQRHLDITEFVAANAIDEIYYETPYFIAPENKEAEEAFVVLREALRRSGRVGIGQLALGGREHLCSIKPCANGMLLETLRYHEELHDSEPYFERIDTQHIDKEALDLAMELIKRKTTRFRPEKFHDRYRDALQELIEAKRWHRQVRPHVKETSPARVVGLMDALRKSLQENLQDNEPLSPPRKEKGRYAASHNRNHKLTG